MKSAASLIDLAFKIFGLSSSSSSSSLDGFSTTAAESSLSKPVSEPSCWTATKYFSFCPTSFTYRKRKKCVISLLSLTNQITLLL
jgi:hypothetical protein